MSDKKIMNQKQKRMGLLYVLIYCLLIPEVGFADVTSTLTNFSSYLTGTWGKIVATLAIVGVGYFCFFAGKLHKGWVVAVVVGCGLVFGANDVLTHITGS